MNRYSIAKKVGGQPVEDYVWAEDFAHARVIADFVGGMVTGEITDDEFVCDDCLDPFNLPNTAFYNQ